MQQANSEYLDILMKGVGEWNEWRRNNAHVKPSLVDANLAGFDLAGANFNETDLGGANLDGADLTEAILTGANLAPTNSNGIRRITSLTETKLIKAKISRADLTEANLAGADLFFADLTEANLREANLRGAKLALADCRKAVLYNADLRGAVLCGAYFNEADLGDANLSRADLQEASLRGADLIQAILSEANLERANFSGANLSLANFKKANLSKTDLSGADLSDAFDFVFDSTFVRNARLLRPSDPWSILRRNYTGPKLLFHLLLLIAFIVPYAAKTFMWVNVNEAQVRLGSLTHELQRQVDAKIPGDTPVAEGTRMAIHEAMERVQPCFAADCSTYQVWQLLIGIHKDGPANISRYLLPAAALALIGYNVFRFVLTWFLGPMRDDEERSGYTPPYGDWRYVKVSKLPIPYPGYGYKWLLGLHRLVVGLMMFAISSFLFNAWNWLTLPVYLPKAGG